MGNYGALGPRISVVVTALDAAADVHAVLRHLPDADEVILVDRGSGDGTPDAAVQARPDVQVLVRPGLCRSAALAVGLAQASGEVIFTVPSDGSFDAEELPAFLTELLGGADAVKGTRYVGTPPPVRDRLLSHLVRRLHGVHLSDPRHGVWGFWADQRDLLSLRADGRRPGPGDVDVTVACQLARAGARLVEVAAPLRNAGRGSLRAGVRAALEERRRVRYAAAVVPHDHGVSATMSDDCSLV
jgi:hypothetical protein